MCLAVPGKIIEINENKAIVDMSGVKLETYLNLLEDVKVDDYVIIHAGFAIEKLSDEEANERLKLFKEIEASWEETKIDT